MRNSHIVAALVGVVLVGFAQWADPTFPRNGAIATVAFTAVLFGLLWECVIRLSHIALSLLGRQHAGER